jgi:S-DNA-T family DNA segregation ATPase FtsK/SpoIIIE
VDAPAFAPVDHLADIAAVLGHETKMLTQTCCTASRTATPSSTARGRSGTSRRVLDEAGHGEYKTGGKMHVSLDRILDAIAARAEDDIDDEGGTED